MKYTARCMADVGFTLRRFCTTRLLKKKWVFINDEAAYKIFADSDMRYLCLGALKIRRL